MGLIGAGTFARNILIPALKTAGFSNLVSVASASGLSAREMAETADFERAVSGAAAVLDDPDVDVVVVATPHESHADLTVKALQAGKHVFCEKPLALTMTELGEVEAAVRDNDGVLFVGFNRRWSSPIAMVQKHFALESGPLMITYRVNAGRLPPSHWYHDRRHGGRLLGEACHFVDTCAAIVGSSATDVHGFTSGRDELMLDQDFILSLRYPDGSLANISYGSRGHSGMEKERVDVTGRGRSGVIVDFREVVLDGRRLRLRSQQKGHLEEVRAFRRALERNSGTPIEFIESTRTTLACATALQRS